MTDPSPALCNGQDESFTSAVIFIHMCLLICGELLSFKEKENCIGREKEFITWVTAETYTGFA